MSFLDQYGLSQNPAFQQRVEAAIVHAALAIASEVANDVQTVSLTQGTATGGTFTLTFGGQTTTAIPYNAAAGTVQTALAALSTVGSGNVCCAGGPVPGSAVTITFCGSLAGAPQQSLTIASSVTGTGSPAYGVAHTTVGVGYVSHAARAALASKVLQNPSGYAALMAIGVTDSSTVMSDFELTSGSYGIAAGKTEAQANSDIQNQVNTVWNAYC